MSEINRGPGLYDTSAQHLNPCHWSRRSLDTWTETLQTNILCINLPTRDISIIISDLGSHEVFAVAGLGGGWDIKTQDYTLFFTCGFVQYPCPSPGLTGSLCPL